KGTLVGPSDTSADEEVAKAQDESLPWPRQAAVEAWWEQRKRAFPEGKRYLSGRPVDPEWLGGGPGEGRAAARAAAAVELCLSGERRVMFEVRARGGRQWSALGA